MGNYERRLKKLRSASPSKLYEMVTNISANPDLAEQQLSRGKRIAAAFVLKYLPSPETSEVLQNVIYPRSRISGALPCHEFIACDPWLSGDGSKSTNTRSCAEVRKQAARRFA